MFSDQYYYEAKVWLRSYADAIECLKQSAEKGAYLAHYDSMMNRIIQAKNYDEIDFRHENVIKGPKFKEMKEYKMFQYSNFIFKKYLKDFDTYNGDYEGLKKILDSGYEKMKVDSE